MNPKKVFFILVILVVIAVAAINWEKINQSPFFSSEVSYPEAITEVRESIEKQLVSAPAALVDELNNSRIYLILSNKTSVHEEEVIQSHVFEGGTLTPVETKETDVSDFYYSYSPDGGKGVFFAIPLERKDEEGDWYSRSALYTFTADDVKDNPFPSLEDSVLITEAPLANKQNPAISNAGEVLFVAHEGTLSETGVSAADDWSIYRVKDKELVFVANGFMPKWISDTEFVFIKNDGVYKGDISSEELVVSLLLPKKGIQGNIFNNSRLDVSADGNTIVWMMPEESLIEVYKKGEEGYQLSGSIPARGFWAALSPAGSFLALQTIGNDYTGREENPEPRVVFYDTVTLAQVPQLIINLDAFDQLKMFMTEWVKK